MRLEERTIDDLLEPGCEICGLPLTEHEMHEARESGRPFLCSMHAAEELPAIAPETVGETSSGETPSTPTH